MATTNSITTTYAGEKAGKYIAAALLQPTTIRNGGLTVKPNIKYKQVLKKVAMSDLIKDASCDYNPTGTVTITENILQPEEFQVNYTLCKSDFKEDWDAISMGYSAHDSLPPSFADFIIGKTVSEVATAYETILWQGSTATSGQFDGFLTKFAADSTVVDVTGTTVTAANVVAQMQLVVDDIPAAIYGKEDLYLYVSQNIYKKYIAALSASGHIDRYQNQGYTNLMFNGVKIFVANGLPDDDMVAAQASNLFFGTGLMRDFNEVKLIDMADIDGSKNVRFVMRYTAGVQYAYGSEIVYYT